MATEILQALSHTTGATCLVLLFCLWLLLRRTGRVSFWWMLVTWLLAWMLVPMIAFISGFLVILFAETVLELDLHPFAMPNWQVTSTAILTMICWVAITRWIGRDMRSRSVFTATCVVALLTAPGPVVTVGSFFLQAHGKAVQTGCHCNLKSVADLLRLHREDHDGVFPECLADLVPEYTPRDDHLRCPADNELYFYVPPRSSNPPPDRPIIVDPNHRYGGSPSLMILFADGSVRRLGVDEPLPTQRHKKE